MIHDDAATLPEPVRRVAAALRQRGMVACVRLFPDQSTRTAEDAARAVGCQVGQIVKSLVFMAGDEPILVLASGAHRVDVTKLEALAGAPVRRASAEEARSATGFAIGGIPPVGHARPLRAFMDEALLRYERVWAAAGSPASVFSIRPAELRRITDAAVAPLAEAAGGGSRPARQQLR